MGMGPSSPQNRAEITTEQAEITTKQAEFTQAEIAKGRDHHDPSQGAHTYAEGEAGGEGNAREN